MSRPPSGSKVRWRGIPLKGALLCGCPSINVKCWWHFRSTKEDKSQLVVREPKGRGGLGKVKCAIHLS